MLLGQVERNTAIRDGLSERGVGRFLIHQARQYPPRLGVVNVANMQPISGMFV
jgi:hypothetical protein